MVGDECPVMMMVTDKYGTMEIVQDKEPPEPEAVAPERIRDPGIQVEEIIRRRVIGYHRRAYIIIVVVYLGGDYGILPFRPRHHDRILVLRPDIYGNLSRNTIKPFQGFSPA
jgi:hypothetical protein